MHRLNHLKVDQPQVAALVAREMRQRHLDWTSTSRLIGMDRKSLQHFVRLENRAPLRIMHRVCTWLNELEDVPDVAAELAAERQPISARSEVDLEALADLVADRVIKRLKVTLSV